MIIYYIMEDNYSDEIYSKLLKSNSYPKRVNLDNNVPVNSQMKRVIKSKCNSAANIKCIKQSYGLTEGVISLKCSNGGQTPTATFSNNGVPFCGCITSYGCNPLSGSLNGLHENQLSARWVGYTLNNTNGMEWLRRGFISQPTAPGEPFIAHYSSGQNTLSWTPNVC